MSRVRWSLIVFMVLALVVSSCSPTATPTPSPRPATQVPATDVPATAASAAETEEPMMEATEVATEEAMMEETEEMALMDETEEAMMEMTEEATEEMVVVVPTLAPTDEPTATDVPTDVPTVAPTDVPTDVPTVAPTMAPTEAPTEVAMMEMTAEATDDMAVDMAGSLMFSADDELVIGVAVGLSGEGIAPLGIDIQRGVELALEDRPTVTVDGVEFTVAIDVQDDLCAAEGGQAVANRFSSDDSVVGVVGPMCSSACRAAAPIFDAAGYTSISPSCTAPDLTASDYTSFNRAVVSDAFQGRIAADYIFRVLGFTSIATIHDGSAYGEGLVNVVTQRFEELGGEVVASDAVTVGDTDFRGLLDDFAQLEPQLIYFGGFPAEAARIIEQRADAGLEDVPFMGADGIRGTEVLELAGESSEGIYATSAISADSEALASFLARYIETYGEEPPAPYHANGYDAANILLDAVEAVGTVDANGDLVIDRAAIADYVRSIENFQGLTGVLTAEGNGETSVSDIGIYQATGGDFQLLSVGNVTDGEVNIMDAPTAEPMMEMTEMATDEAMMEEMTPDLVEMAQHEARAIHAEDPDLQQPEHRLLAQRVLMLRDARSDVS